MATPPTVRRMTHAEPRRHESPTPIYQQVADALAERIADMPADTLVPSEEQIVGEFGVARGTARRAIQELRDRDLIYTIARRGSYKKPQE